MKNKSAENLVNKTAVKPKRAYDKTLMLVQGALIAALYAGATWLSSLFGVAYGPVQFRFSEALTVLSLFSPAAVPGLAVGCAISNISSPYGILDIALGTLATLLSALCARGCAKIRIKNIPLLSIIMPAFFNAFIVGAEITFSLGKEAGLSGFLLNALTVGAGELAVCLICGIPLYLVIRKAKIFKEVT